MSYIVVDVESDGGIIGENSMVCFGAVIVDKKLDKTFYRIFSYNTSIRFYINYYITHYSGNLTIDIALPNLST